MNSLYDWEAHGTCRTTQTWPTKTWSGPWTKMSSTVGKTTTHASLPLLIGPTMLCCLAKILPRGKPSRLTMAQLQVFSLDSTWTEKFLCWITEFIEGISNISSSSVCCQPLTLSSFLILTCFKNQTSILIMTARLLILTFGRNFESSTLLGQAVPLAFLEKHWWRSNNKTAVLKP